MKLMLFFILVPYGGQVLGYDCPNFVSILDFRDNLENTLDAGAGSFYDSGATFENTLQDNEDAFSRYNLLPDLPNDVSHRDITTSILGTSTSFPVGIAPIAALRMAHEEGEKAVALVAQTADTLMILSTFSTFSMEDVVASAPNVKRWFQLYPQKDKEVTKSLIKRAQESNFSAIVVSIDSPIFGISWENMANDFSFPKNISLANLNLKVPNGMDELKYAHSLLDTAFTWKDVAWIKGLTKLPIIIKGVLTPKQAKMAVKQGASAIIVSNHGGRTLDGTPATIDALADIVNALDPEYPVFLDGGIRTGTDIVKALAIGAKFVFIGKPVVWGLSYKGQAGVTCVLDILKTEFENAMALSGAPNVSSLKSDLVVKQSYFTRYVTKKNEL